MAGTKQKEPNQKKISEVAEIIIYAHDLMGTKPDASHFGKWGAMIKKFLKPEVAALRQYTKAELIKFIDYLGSNNIPFNPEYLYIPSYLSFVIEEKLGSANAITARIKKQLQELEVDDDFGRNRPRGW